MKNIYIYALPIAVGLLGLLVSPLADVTGVAYGLVVTSIIAGILGLRSITQSNVTRTQQWQETLHQELGTVVSSNQRVMEEEKTSRLELENTLSKIQSVLEEMHETTRMGQAHVSSQLMEIEEKLEDGQVMMSSLGKLAIEQMTEVIQSVAEELNEKSHSLEDSLSKIQNVFEEIYETTKTGQTDVSEQLMEIGEKLTDSQVIVSTLGKLMIEAVQSATEGLDTLENTLTNQQVDLAEELRERFEGVDQQLEKQTEQAEAMAENIQQTITSGMEESAQVITSQTDKFLSHTKEINEFTKEQFNKIVQLFEEVEKLSQAVKLQNDQQNRVVTAQLGQLAEISPALVEGISQLTDSKSPERKHLLKIQKNMIEKFTNLTS